MDQGPAEPKLGITETLEASARVRAVPEKTRRPGFAVYRGLHASGQVGPSLTQRRYAQPSQIRKEAALSSVSCDVSRLVLFYCPNSRTPSYVALALAGKLKSRG